MVVEVVLLDEVKVIVVLLALPNESVVVVDAPSNTVVLVVGPALAADGPSGIDGTLEDPDRPAADRREVGSGAKTRARAEVRARARPTASTSVVEVMRRSPGFIMG
jgi:hypothetical protein